MVNRDFKFLSDNNETRNIDDDSPSWMWVTEYFNYDRDYDVIVSNHNGIHDFLSMFPRRSIQFVRKISGWCRSDNDIRAHEANTDYPDGWGFDITRDLITIEWIRFN